MTDAQARNARHRNLTHVCNISVEINLTVGDHVAKTNSRRRARAKALAFDRGIEQGQQTLVGVQMEVGKGEGRIGDSVGERSVYIMESLEPYLGEPTHPSPQANAPGTRTHIRTRSPFKMNSGLEVLLNLMMI